MRESVKLPADLQVSLPFSKTTPVFQHAQLCRKVHVAALPPFLPYLQGKKQILPQLSKLFVRIHLYIPVTNLNRHSIGTLDTKLGEAGSLNTDLCNSFFLSKPKAQS